MHVSYFVKTAIYTTQLVKPRIFTREIHKSLAVHLIGIYNLLRFRFNLHIVCIVNNNN